MAHTALARTYRPRTFGEVATQEHVSETLRRAVATGRVGHAYLFCGPRGVGKTTLARVLAMALNCPDRTAEGEPCGVCESCRRIWTGGTALDVVEIDAATNRGVEDARSLRERAMYAPSSEERHKVYIVDEAHMLTREAWNALLKVLEEPPPRVIFVFATTEPQKIQQMASPILSRCQRFDFRRIGQSDIVTRLRTVLAGEGIEAPDDALRMVARRADGGMRDALSLLDQVLALTGGDISADSTRRVLGLVEEERFVEVMTLIRDRQPEGIFPFVEELLDEGYDLVEFHQGLVDALRALLQLRLDPTATPPLLESVRVDFHDLASGFEPGDLVRMLALASELESGGALRRTSHPRVLLELLLLRLSYLDRTVELESLLKAMGGAPPPTPPSRSPSSTPPAGSGGEAPSPGPGETAPRSGPPPSREVAAPRPPARTAPAREAEGPRGRAAADTAGPPPVAAAGRPLPADAGSAPEPSGRPVESSPPPVDWSTFMGGEIPVPTERITHEVVQEDRLRELLSREPVLRRAVEVLDLELMD